MFFLLHPSFLRFSNYKEVDLVRNSRELPSLNFLLFVLPQHVFPDYQAALFPPLAVHPSR